MCTFILEPELFSEVTVSNLDPDISEADIVHLLSDVGLTATRVNLPRESRRKRPCGTAFVVSLGLVMKTLMPFLKFEAPLE